MGQITRSQTERDILIAQAKVHARRYISDIETMPQEHITELFYLISLLVLASTGYNSQKLYDRLEHANHRGEYYRDTKK